MLLLAGMPLKNPTERKRYHARYMKEVWYPRNKQKHIGYVKRNKKEVTDFIQRYKKAGKCADCGFSGKDFPYVLDFDHKKDTAEKSFNIGNWSQAVLSTGAIRREMEKCELVCANCHRIRTFSNKNTADCD